MFRRDIYDANGGWFVSGDGGSERCIHGTRRDRKKTRLHADRPFNHLEKKSKEKLTSSSGTNVRCIVRIGL